MVSNLLHFHGSLGTPRTQHVVRGTESLPFRRKVCIRNDVLRIQKDTTPSQDALTSNISELSSGEHASTASSSNDVPLEEPKYDNFYSPKNAKFYSKFKYSDLDITEHHIRLLRIHPPERADDTKAQVRCDLLENVSMEDMKGKYTTISYCAGDPKKTEVIVVNGVEFNAFANLGHALRQARHFWTDRFNNNQELILWVDQVCINQSNPLERSHQVSFMGTIYATAEQVLVSLSKEGDIAGGLGWLKDPEYQRDSADWGDAEESFEEVPVGTWFQEKKFHTGLHAFYATVANSQWWSRAWIRQEFLLSDDAYFMAAFEHMHWRHATDTFLFKWLQGSMDLKPDDSHSDCDFQDCLACTMIEHKARAKFFFGFSVKATHLILEKRFGTDSDLLWYLRSFSWVCEASDPRDLIYAFFALSNNNFGLQPDYSENYKLQNLLTDLARKAVSSDLGLKILYETKPYSWRSSPGLASWVPTWDLGRYLEGSGASEPQILQARGTLDGSLPSLSQTSEILCFQSPRCGATMRFYGDARAGDEVWTLDGLEDLFLFRRDGLYHRFLGRTIVESLDQLEGSDQLVEESVALIKTNSPLVQTINII